MQKVEKYLKVYQLFGKLAKYKILELFNNIFQLIKISKLFSVLSLTLKFNQNSTIEPIVPSFLILINWSVSVVLAGLLSTPAQVLFSFSSSCSASMLVAPAPLMQRGTPAPPLLSQPEESGSRSPGIKIILKPEPRPQSRQYQGKIMEKVQWENFEKIPSEV